MMKQQDYEQIREWLYAYPEWEMIFKEYFLTHHTFLNLADLMENSEIFQFDFASHNASGLPSLGLCDIEVEKYRFFIPSVLNADHLINPLYDLGFFKHPRYCKSHKHAHNYYELEYVLDGKAHQTIWAGAAKHSFILSKGGFLLLPPTVSHEVYVDDESILLNLMIRKDACENAILRNLPSDSDLLTFFRKALCTNDPSYVVFQTDNALELQECFFDLLIENDGNGRYRRELANLKTSILFLNLLGRMGMSIEYDNRNMKASDYIPAIISYMEQCYDTVTPKQIADVFGFSRTHLGRIYKQHTGTTLQDSICAIRMRHARTLLQESGYSVEQIGQMTGYDDVTNFIRCFKARNGLTPHQYRLSYKN